MGKQELTESKNFCWKKVIAETKGTLFHGLKHSTTKEGLEYFALLIECNSLAAILRMGSVVQ